MEYTLYSIFYLFQSFFNLLMNLEVVPGVSVGGVLISVFILSVILGCLGVFLSPNETELSEQKAEHLKSVALHEYLRGKR